MSIEGEEEAINLSDLFSNGLGSVPAMSAIIGSLGEFDANEEQWDSYIERFELFLKCNKVEEDLKVSTLLTVVGVKTFKLLRDLCTPDSPAGKEYGDLVQLIKDYLYPKPSFIAERYKFSLRNQLETETIAQYLASLKHLSTHCDFGANLNDYLRDRLVSGIRSESTKQRLLGETALTLEKAVSIISSVEAAERNAASLTPGANFGRIQRMTSSSTSRSTWRPGASSSSGKTMASCSERPHQQPADQSAKSNTKCQVKCYCCGAVGHMSKSCRLKGCTCHFCGKKNHISKVCRVRLSGKSTQSYNSSKINSSKRSHHYVNNVETVDDSIIEDVPNLFAMYESKIEKILVPIKQLRVEPFKTNLVIDNNLISFEIDTGASVSVANEKFYNDHFKKFALKPTSLCLSSYTNTPIEPMGVIEVNVTYKGVTKQLDLYIIKNGANPLIGRDWIKALNVEITPNPVNNELFVADTISSKVDNNPNFDKLRHGIVKSYPEVFTEKLGQCVNDPVRLILKENSVPKYFRPRPLPYTLKSKVEKELERLIDLDILYPVNSSEYGSPIVPVLKKDGSIRICGDYKVTINPQLEIDRYPIPRVEDIFAELQKGELFSKIDLSQAYMQLRLDEASQKLCTISTHKGLFAYKRMPFGISSAVGIFQRVIEQVLQGLSGVKVFLDDILITGSDTQSHLKNIEAVCDRLKQYGFTVKQNKCKFFVSKLEFLGFTIDKEGLHTSETKVKAIVDAPVPKNVTEVKSFLGLVNYYGKFVPNLSTILTPLYNLLKKDNEFVFNKTCLQAFNDIKRRLSSAPVLAHYDPEAEVVLTVDASSCGIGSVLSIIGKDGLERPVSYASRTLNSAESHYSQIDKEALAVVYGVKKFHQYLYGRHFTLKSDHKPLLSIFGPKKGLPVFAASRLQRYALFLSGYDFDIKYVKSGDNSADALSRLPLKVNESESNYELLTVGTYLNFVEESSVPISCNQVRAETQKDKLLKRVYGYVMFGWPNHLSDNDNDLTQYFLRREEITVEQGILMLSYKVIIPSSLRRFVLNELHASHLGITKMKSVARSYVWWPNIDQEIEQIANSCSSCLLERANPAKSELHHWHYPSKPWERLHLDYLGPFKGKMYLIVIDAHTKWLEVFETSSTSASEAINNLRQLFARFGLPVTIHSDNGSPFSSLEFKNFLVHNGIRQTFSAPYHPQSNGQAENSVKYAKNKLKCAFRDNINVSVALSRILFDYRNSVHSTTNETPAKLMFNRPLRTRLDLLRPDVSRKVENNQDKQKYYAKGNKTRLLSVNQSVLIRDYRSNGKWIEGTVVKQISLTMYIVRISSGILWKRHIDQLVPIEAPLDESADQLLSEYCPQTGSLLRPSGDGDTTPDVTVHTPLRTSRQSIPRQPTPLQSTPVSGTADRTRTPNVQADRAIQCQTPKRYPVRIKKPVQRLDL